jgi:hypothetical protein
MSLVYMTQVSTDDYQDFISEFCKTGELTKRAVDGEARRRLSGTDLTKSFKKCIGYDLSNPYKQLSKTVHATIFHMHANTQLVPGTDDSVEIRIYGEKLEYPQRLYDELRGLVEVCINTIEQVLASRYTQHEKGDSHEYL